MARERTGTFTTSSDENGAARTPRGSKLDANRQETSSTKTPDLPRSVAITRMGITTGTDFANLMSALMADVIEERISPNIANAAVNAGGKLLKVVEMQYRYGKNEPTKPNLILAERTP